MLKIFAKVSLFWLPEMIIFEHSMVLFVKDAETPGQVTLKL
jgi:hypothetical protein